MVRGSELSQPSVDEASVSRAELSARLLGGLAHEVKNPLNAMAINLEVIADKLRERNGGEVPEELRKNLAALKAQIGRVDLLVRRASDFAVPRERAPGAVPISRLLESAVALGEHEARRAGVVLEVDAPPELNAHGVEDVLVHALLLLLLASVPAVGRGGRLRLAARDGGERVSITGLTAGAPASLPMGALPRVDLAARLLTAQGGALVSRELFSVELTSA